MQPRAGSSVLTAGECRPAQPWSGARFSHLADGWRRWVLPARGLVLTEDSVTWELVKQGPLLRACCTRAGAPMFTHALWKAPNARGRRGPCGSHRAVSGPLVSPESRGSCTALPACCSAARCTLALL